MNIAINKVHFPVTTLGYGRRVGIWTQGCSIRCPGCISRDTWEHDEKRVTTVDRLATAVSPWLIAADGVTVSGGEPFDQPEALGELIRGVRKLNNGDILVFSGYAQDVLLSEHREIIELIDVLVSEPYRPDSGTTLTLRGSDNQRISILTDLGRARYSAGLDVEPWAARRRLDLFFEGDAVWMAGIPQAGEMAHLRDELARRGVACNTSDQQHPRIRA